jgi:hypothetical protein
VISPVVVKEPVVINPATVRFPSVPNEVREELTTFEARVVPVIVDAATEPANPVTDPFMGLVTVKSVNVPTEVNEEVTIPDDKTVPVRSAPDTVIPVSKAPLP